LDQKDKKDANGTILYGNGPMKAAYGAFLSSLIMIKCHDMIADQAAAQYNVTWTRTTPIIVSVFDDAYRTVITLECDHRFGMDVTGETGNVTAFRYACSSAINPLEHYVMKTLFPDGNGTSIVMGIGKEIFNGQMPGIFLSNGYLVFKSSVNDMFLIFDPTTGILRDVMYLNGTVSGAGCFSDLQTEWIYDLGEKLKSINLSAQPEWLNSTAQIGLFAGTVLGSCLADVTVLGSMTVGTVALSAALPVLGVFVACYIFDYCVDQGWLPPERCREILGILPPFAIINKLVYNEEPLFELTKITKQYAITEGKLVNKAIKENLYSKNTPPPKGDKAAFLRNLYNKSVGWIKDGVNDISAARSATGTAKITLSASGIAKIIVGTGGIEFWGTYFGSELLPDKTKEQILKLIS